MGRKAAVIGKPHAQQSHSRRVVEAALGAMAMALAAGIRKPGDEPPELTMEAIERYAILQAGPVEVAAELGLTVYDLDLQCKKRHGKTYQELFAQHAPRGILLARRMLWCRALAGQSRAAEALLAGLQGRQPMPGVRGTTPGHMPDGVGALGPSTVTLPRSELEALVAEGQRMLDEMAREKPDKVPR